MFFFDGNWGFGSFNGYLPGIHRWRHAIKIISGIFGGRTIRPPGGRETRPTSARAREAIFSILGGDLLGGARVLDLFCGTGAMGLEAISRGAASVVFIDNAKAAIVNLKSNIDQLGVGEMVRVLPVDVLNGLKILRDESSLFDLVFLDPPYGAELLSLALERLGCFDLTSSGAVVVAESSASQTLPEVIGKLSLMQRRCYGDSAFFFYSKE